MYKVKSDSLFLSFLSRNERIKMLLALTLWYVPFQNSCVNVHVTFKNCELFYNCSVTQLFNNTLSSHDYFTEYLCTKIREFIFSHLMFTLTF